MLTPISAVDCASALPADARTTPAAAATTSMLRIVFSTPGRPRADAVHGGMRNRLSGGLEGESVRTALPIAPGGNP